MKKIILYLIIHLTILPKIPENIFLPTRNFQPSFPYITGATVRSICKHKLDPTETININKIEPGDTIFVMVNLLEHFFEIYHPLIKEKYILVTHHFFDEADAPVPGKFSSYLDDEKLIAWFTHNVDIAHHPKLYPMPIGIANSCFDFGDKSVFDHSIKFIANKLPKENLLYMNFLMDRYPKERKPLYFMFRNKNFCKVEQPVKSLDLYLTDLALSKFVLSPRGNGLDCYRTWEALLMGCYPIVKTSTLDSLYHDLPVIIINKWSEVTKEFLEKKYIELTNKKYNLEKLYMPYWMKKIRKIQKIYRSVKNQTK